MDSITLDISDILQLLPHRYPMLMVDKTEVISEKEAYGYKNVTYNEPYFTGHFPDDPVMPGVMVIEMCMQTIHVLQAYKAKMMLNGGVKSCYYAKISKARFFRSITVGDSLQARVRQVAEADHMITFKVMAMMEEEKVFSAEITALLRYDEEA